MSGMKHLLWLVLMGWAVAAPFEEGQFAVAYEQGRSSGGINGWLMAAKAANSYASYSAKGDTEILGWFARAQAAAQKALEANPRSAEAHFELARAIGGTLNHQSLLTKVNLVGVMRDHLNEALKLRPDLPEVRVALALWNLEVSENGVGWLYGADKGRVKPLFEEALRLEPNSVAARGWYGWILLRLGDKAAAKAQLEKVVALTPHNAVDRFEWTLAKERLAELR